MQNDQTTISISTAGDVGLRYHAQDDATYCGAAVAQMILRPFEQELEDQDALAYENSLHNPPEQVNGVCLEGLVLTLNQYVARTFTFEQPADPLSAAAAELIRTKSGVAALVNGGSHWVALNGVVMVPGDPASSGFYVHDPHARISPSSHDDQDACGSGGACGFANQFLTFLGMRRFCDPVALVYAIEPRAAAPAAAAPRVAAEQRMTGPADEWSAAGLTPTRSGLTSPASEFEPLAATASAIAAVGIAEHGPLATILAGFEAAASVPLDDVYHVTLRRGARVIGYALLARGDGALLAVTASGDEWPLMDLSAQSVRSELDRNRAAIERIDPEFSYELDDRHAAVEASFFWRPCREAPSPSQPLVRISVGSHVLYRDHFGTFHARLHVLDR